MAAITVTEQITDILARYRDLTRANALALLQEVFDDESRQLRLTNDVEDIALVANQRVYSFSASSLLVMRVWDAALVFDADSANPLEKTTIRRFEVESRVPRIASSGTPEQIYQELSAAGAKQIGLRPPPDVSTIKISGATNATPIVVSTTAAHSLTNGQAIYEQDVLGNTAANGSFYAKTTGYTSTTYALYSDSTLLVPVAGSGAYTSGGMIATVTIPFLRVWVTRKLTLAESAGTGLTISLPDTILTKDYLSSGVWVKHARRRHPDDLSEHLQLFHDHRTLMRQTVTSLFPEVTPRVQPSITRTSKSRTL